MQDYIRKLKQFMLGQYSYEDSTLFHSLLEMIWFYHTQYYPIDSEKIQEEFRSMSSILKTLSHKREVQLTRLVVELCIEHERVAFVEGVRVGSQLFIEMCESEETVSFDSPPPKK